MRIDAEKEKRKLLSKNERKDGPLFKIENDPRITTFGKWIRKFDIDELPQLYNVLIGNMSLIGPRPHLKDEVKLYKEYQKRVLTLKPGITGMAQSHGRHENTFYFYFYVSLRLYSVCVRSCKTYNQSPAS